MTARISQASNVSLLGAKLNCTNTVAGSCKQAVKPESTPVGRTNGTCAFCKPSGGNDICKKASLA